MGEDASSETRQLRLDGARARSARRDRPGPGAPSRPQFAGPLGVLNTVMTGAPITHVRDDIYLVDVVARAQDEQRVSLVDLARPAGSAAQRPHGAAGPDRDVSISIRNIRWSGGATAFRRSRCRPTSSPARRRRRRCGRSRRRSTSCGPRLPDGLPDRVGGTVEESAKSQASVFAMVPADAVPDAAVPDGAAAQFQPRSPWCSASCRWASSASSALLIAPDGRSALSPFSAFWP